MRWILALLLTTGCGDDHETTPSSNSGDAPTPDGSSADAPPDLPTPGATWETASPDEVGLDPGELEAFRAAVGGRGVVVRGGKLVYSWGEVDRASDVASAVKPLYTHFLLVAIEEARLGNVDDLVEVFEPRLDDLNPDLGHKDRRITWRHLANQISCYGVREAPGAAFDYSDFNMALLFDTLFLAVYGSTLEGVDAEVLAARLGNTLQLEDDPTFLAFGPDNRAGRLAISPRDFARLGLLYLRQGVWRGQALVPAAAAVMVTSSPVPTSVPRTSGQEADMIAGQRSIGGGNNQTDHDGSYSFAWWVNGVDRAGRRNWPSAPVDTYGAFGHGGVRALVVIPSLDLVASWNDSTIESRDATDVALGRLAGAVLP